MYVKHWNVNILKTLDILEGKRGLRNELKINIGWGGELRGGLEYRRGTGGICDLWFYFISRILD